MIRILFSLLFALVLAVSLMTGVQADDGHRKWLSDRIIEAHSIQPGMSRAQLLKVFDVEGGLQSIPATRYVLKSCPMIKIDVTFKPGVAGRSISVTEPIATVSKVYLDHVIAD